ncbi:expressed unknown protein [Seminavis robusta]|uniref:Uncharacterized protein n=1 Tax=Seminavis robusta TaxID=568900 RepID=A0A9N8EE02_9STRA|nr:expressed unknown protein [Seminavis robusta]|eukprot:Sro1039_g234370.1 n/a (607) ;mRNA; f:15423-17243
MVHGGGSRSGGSRGGGEARVSSHHQSNRQQHTRGSSNSSRTVHHANHRDSSPRNGGIATSTTPNRTRGENDGEFARHGASSRMHHGRTSGRETPSRVEDIGQFTRHGGGTRTGRSSHRHGFFDRFRPFSIYSNRHRRREEEEEVPVERSNHWRQREPLLWRRTHRQRRHVIPGGDDDDDDGCDCNPCLFCCCFLSCLTCCCREGVSGLGRSCGNLFGSPGRFCGDTCGSLFSASRSTLPVLVATALLFAILCVFSSQNETWTLNAGESRQIHPTWLTRAVEVQYLWSQHDAIDVSVYAFAKKCPPLTGPIKKVSEQHGMTFGNQDFQFDYFFLNKGSKVEADFTQLQGASNVYLLRGQDKISILQQDDILHDEDKWSDLLKSSLKTWRLKDTYRQPTVGRFQADRNDAYTLLYDNPYPRGADLLVDLWFELTTFNVKGKTPICSDIAFNSCPPIQTEFAKCIILDTSPWHDNSQGNEEISIRIIGKRDFSFIALLSLIPGVLVILYKIWSCLKNRRRTSRQRVSREDEEHGGANASAREGTAATAPPSEEDESSTPLLRPSAPLASEDASAPADEAIPVAAARIVEDSAPDAIAVTPVEAPRDGTK